MLLQRISWVRHVKRLRSAPTPRQGRVAALVGRKIQLKISSYTDQSLRRMQSDSTVTARVAARDVRDCRATPWHAPDFSTETDATRPDKICEPEI